MKQVAVIDDEQDIRDLVELHLKRAGYSTVCFENGSDFFSWLSAGNKPSLCILDIMLPDMQGTDICRRIRSSEELSTLPVIMLTALGHEADRVTGLELGADDYVTKPFSPRELTARVRAVLRRQRTASAESSRLFCGAVEMDAEAFSLKVNGKNTQLTSTEFRILRILLEGKGKVFSRSKLLRILWGGEKFVFERTIDVHIRNIREKLGSASEILQNVRGVGYRVGEPD
jgi:DNA-binding response OmpR family regulator